MIKQKSHILAEKDVKEGQNTTQSKSVAEAGDQKEQKGKFERFVNAQKQKQKVAKDLAALSRPD